MPEPAINECTSGVLSIPDELRTELPLPVQDAIGILPEYQQKLIARLYVECGQSHLFEGFTSAISPSVRRQFGNQLEELDRSYVDGGLDGYIKNARRLLDDSRRGVNPLEDWEPHIPEGQTFHLGSDSWKRTELEGRKHLGKVGFVLVAGGLGERLGYSDIKIGLPTEMTTETSYLKFYIEYILAVQKKYGNGKKLPLCIMTSKDTNERTIKILRDNDGFGMVGDQVTIVQQGVGVPALQDNEARLALDAGTSGDIYFKLQTKPHGHGDVHELLHSRGVAEQWLKDGIEWLTIFQDTNGLAFHALTLMLGVSSKMDLIMNSLAVPRKAKQAIGGIVKLENKKSGEVRTINVEYNQLDPLLRGAGHSDGDVNDPDTGYSAYPGNVNQLLFKLEPYVEALKESKGLMPEFVNPKYRDAKKTVFKKPTRLECMMQDFPTVLKGKAAKRVGFTSAPANICFSPVKNANDDGVDLQEKRIHPATAATGEADQYAAHRIIMNTIGCLVEEAPQEEYHGIMVNPGPAIVLKPDFVMCPGDYFDRFPFPRRIKISPRSTLIVRGSGVIIESLDLDGTFIIDAKDGEAVTIRDKVVRNLGWSRVRDEASDNEIVKMRGYRIEKVETETHDDSICVVM